MTGVRFAEPCSTPEGIVLVQGTPNRQREYMRIVREGLGLHPTSVYAMDRFFERYDQEGNVRTVREPWFRERVLEFLEDQLRDHATRLLVVGDDTSASVSNSVLEDKICCTISEDGTVNPPSMEASLPPFVRARMVATGISGRISKSARRAQWKRTKLRMERGSPSRL